MYADILQSVRALAAQYAAPFDTIEHGALPIGDGISIAPASGAEESRHFDQGGFYTTTYVLNGKHDDLGALLGAMSSIHANITTLTDYPRTDEWEITGITTVGAPAYLEREDSTRKWLYGSSFQVSFYKKGEC